MVAVRFAWGKKENTLTLEGRFTRAFGRIAPGTHTGMQHKYKQNYPDLVLGKHKTHLSASGVNNNNKPLLRVIGSILHNCPPMHSILRETKTVPQLSHNISIHTHTHTHKNIQKSTYTHQIFDPPKRQNKLVEHLNSLRNVGGSRIHRMPMFSLRCPHADIQVITTFNVLRI